MINTNRTKGAAKAESRKFTGDVIWFAVAQLFVSIILGLVTLPALTKSYTPLVYGIWIQMNVTVDFISPLLSLQLGLAAVRFLAGEENAEKRRRALGAMLSTTILIVLIVCAAGVVFSRQLSSSLFNSPEYATYIDFLVIWVAFNAVFNFLQSYLRARSLIKEISIIQIILTTLKVAAILVLATQAAPIGSVFTAMVVLQVVFTIVTLAIIIRETGFPLPGLQGLGTFLWYGIPQTPVVVLLFAISFSDRYFITKFAGLSETAVYSSSAMLAGLAAIFYSPISLVLFPQVSRLWAQNRKSDAGRYFESSIKLFLTLAIPAAVGIAIISQPLLRILTTSDFLAGREVVFLLAAGSVFLGLYQININAVLVDHRARWLPLVTSSAYVTSVVMNFVLVPHLGILGAAISNCAAFFVIAAITGVWARRTIPYALNLRYLGKVTASAGIMLAGLTLVKVDTYWQMGFAIVVGSVIFGLGLVISRGVSLTDGKTIRTTLRDLLKSTIEFKQKEEEKGN